MWNVPAVGNLQAVRRPQPDSHNFHLNPSLQPWKWHYLKQSKNTKKHVRLLGLMRQHNIDTHLSGKVLWFQELALKIMLFSMGTPFLLPNLHMGSSIKCYRTKNAIYCIFDKKYLSSEAMVVTNETRPGSS